MDVKFEIRTGTEADAAPTYDLIKELALFEKAPEAVTNTLDQYRKDGFEHNLYKLIVAEREGTGEVLGMALYFFSYSTWKGRHRASID